MDGVVDFFKDYGPISAFIMGLTGIILSSFFFLKNRKHKKLEYIISNKTALFNKLHSKIKIFFNEQEITEDACLSILTLENIGNEPIKEEEFEKNKHLKVNFVRKDGKPATIFDVEIDKSNPSDFEIEFDHTEVEGTLSIKPILFNPKDYVRLKVISTEFEKIDISGRIIGGSIVNGEKRKKRKEYQYVYVPLMMSLIGSLVAFISSAFINKIEFAFFSSMILIIFGVVVLTLKVVRQ
ncbi:hypothetical protein [Bacillus sp. BML-BC060]|uniref:hypothetical protein n=1 Tax=Bacillus sp. BML-BC060 TaxID=2842487 RepID=UPI001C7F4198|nr:hypothetical protein [Bacillus sp. BML-BC060]